MIRVTVEMDKWGLGTRQPLGSMTIINDGTGGQTVGHYDVAAFKEGRKIATRRGRVEHWPRNRSVLRLVSAALQALGYE